MQLIVLGERDTNSKIAGNQIKNAIQIWKNHISDNKIGILNLFKYDFEPSFNLLILNKKIVLLQLFIPYQNDWGLKLQGNYVINDLNNDGKSIVLEIIDWFESTLTEKCEKIE